MKPWWLVILVLAVLLLLMGLIGRTDADSAFSHSREMTALRNIAHQVLLSNHDSTSRVLPVQQLSKQEYSLRFENPGAIKPEELVAIFSRHFNQQPEYSVEVRKMGHTDIEYSFLMSAQKERTIVPCLGRTLPEDRYELLVRFPAQNNGSLLYWGGGAMLLVAAGGWILLKKKKTTPPPVPPVPAAPPENNAGTRIGQFVFHADQQSLILHDQLISLTRKEAQLLAILARAPNNLVDRSQLQKEVWEDEGVLVTRSLDMFISKLRKKLSRDPAIKIVNMHGKGYKLEVG